MEKKTLYANIDVDLLDALDVEAARQRGTRTSVLKKYMIDLKESHRKEGIDYGRPCDQSNHPGTQPETA